MAFSFPSSLDLNLALPTQTWAQGVAPVWAPYFATSRGPVTVNDSIFLDNEVAIGVARNLVTSRDGRVLASKDDNRLVSEVVALSVQTAASIASVRHRLISKTHEVQFLRAQLVPEQNLVDEYQRENKRLKKERTRMAEENQRQFHLLQEENEKLSKMVAFYSKEMQKQLEVFENYGKRK
ncbi:hypothetical protein L3X38_003510 [Prunus dulcis]|uniref:Uncharacterized protein n=1 Tax=Prunus dulcis TaxID=3755 RepID=A0AAD4ZM92_PRUDU|nr:hypothetical protein L3X38_003510 [Prunus dulcis]